MKKEDLFATLRGNTYVQYDMPEMAIGGITYPDRLRQFVEMTESVGGHVLELGEGEDLNDAVRRAYPDARVFASHLPEITIAGKIPTPWPRRPTSTAPMWAS